MSFRTTAPIPVRANAYQLFTQPANGTVTLNDNGTPADLTDDRLSYPHANFSGNDIFTYVMNETPDTGGLNSTGTVTVVAVAAVNDPPIIANDTASATEDTVTTITATSLLSNDSPGVGETSPKL